MPAESLLAKLATTVSPAIQSRSPVTLSTLPPTQALRERPHLAQPLPGRVEREGVPPDLVLGGRAPAA